MNVVVLVCAVFLTMLGWWQLDHFVAPLIWERKGEKIEVAVIPFLGPVYLEYREFYVMCYATMFLGFLLAILWGVL